MCGKFLHDFDLVNIIKKCQLPLLLFSWMVFLESFGQKENNVSKPASSAFLTSAFANHTGVPIVHKHLKIQQSSHDIADSLVPFNLELFATGGVTLKML